MEVSLWVPLVVAFIGGVSTILAARTSRRRSPDERHRSEVELALAGMVALVTEVQEERKECRKEVAQLRDQVARLLALEREVV